MTLAVEQTHSFVAWLLAHCHRNFDESTLSRAIFPSLLPFVFPCKKLHLEVRNQIVIVKHAEERHSRYGNCVISSCLDNGDAFFRMEKSTSTYSQATRHSDCVWQLKIEVVHKPDRVTGNTGRSRPRVVEQRQCVSDQFVIAWPRIKDTSPTGRRFWKRPIDVYTRFAIGLLFDIREDRQSLLETIHTKRSILMLDSTYSRFIAL